MIWSDTLLTNTVTGQPAGECNKLAVNGLALAIGAGRGWGRLASEADVTLLAGATLDAIVPAVCATLRRSAARLAPTGERRARYSFTGCGYLIAGWSHEAGRFVVYDLDARSIFEPALATELLAPAVNRAYMTLPTLAEIATLATEQAGELRARCGYSVGRLTIATMTLRGITIMPPVEIAPPPMPGSGADAAPAPSSGGSGAGEASLSTSLAA